MFRWQLLFLLLLFLAPAGWSEEVPARAPCAVCSANGTGHGEEPVAATYEYQGKTYYFCEEACKQRFAADPQAFLNPPSARGNFGKLEPWTLVDSAGQAHPSTDYQGKVLVVDLWATWCPPCVKEIPQFMEMQGRLGTQGLAVLGISFDKEDEPHQQFLSEHKVNYPSALAASPDARALLKQLQGRIGAIKAIPVTVVLDRQGTIVYRKVGPVDAEFEQAVTAALEAR